MAGHNSELIDPNTDKTKLADKDKKVSKESVGSILGKSFESKNKEAAAHKIAESQNIWEKLIPKPERDKPEAPAEIAEPVVAERAEAKEANTEAGLENLSRSEQAEVAQAYATDKLTELAAEPKGDTDPAEAAAAAASVEFYEKLAEDPAAVPEIIEDIPANGVEDEASELAPEEAVDDTSELIDVAPGPEEVPEYVPPEAPAELAHDEAIEFNRAAETDDEPATAQATTAASPAAAAGGAGARGGTAPPAPPSGAPGGPANPNSYPFAGNGPGSPNTAPASFNPNTAPSTTVENNYYQDNGGAYLLAGGILGYMLGRRRGRIKTEKKLKAVTKNLERQIKQTHERIDRQEQTIRAQARERFNERRGVETAAARGEQPQRPRAERQVASPAEIAAVGVAPEQIQRLQPRELLAVAEKITVEGTNLRQIYEAKQITEPGLRRLSQEYLRGGDITAALAQEKQVKEMQYERDPQMRDRLAASYAEIDAANPQASSDALASLLAHGSQPKVENYQSAQAAADQSDKDNAKPGSQTLVSAWITLVVILVIIIVVLALR